MRIASSTFPDNFVLQVNQLQDQQNRLQQEASTGLKLTLPEDDPAAMGQVLNLQTEQGANTQYQSNITTLQDQATAASSTITSLQTIINRAGEIATLADGTASPTQLSSYATEVSSLIQQALQLGNAKDSQGNYLYGGTSTGAPPFVATTDAGGNVTGVTYQGNAAQAQTEIAPGQTVSAQIPGENTTGSGARGLFADSRYGSDVISHLISLQQHLASGNTSAIASTDAPAVTSDENNILEQVSLNGALQNRLQAASSMATQTGTALTSRISDKTDADLATVLTQFQQAQTAYQAALQSGVAVMNLTILDFIH